MEYDVTSSEKPTSIAYSLNRRVMRVAEAGFFPSYAKKMGRSFLRFSRGNNRTSWPNISSIVRQSILECTDAQQGAGWDRCRRGLAPRSRQAGTLLFGIRE